MLDTGSGGDRKNLPFVTPDRGPVQILNELVTDAVGVGWLGDDLGGNVAGRRVDLGGGHLPRRSLPAGDRAIRFGYAEDKAKS